MLGYPGARRDRHDRGCGRDVEGGEAASSRAAGVDGGRLAQIERNHGPPERADAAREATQKTSDYLLSTPLVADYLADGLEALGYAPEEY